MTTYVYSLLNQATDAHVGTAQGTFCRRVFRKAYVETGERPMLRRLCERCVVKADLAVSDLGPLRPGWAQRDVVIAALLHQGCDNLGVARRLRIGERTSCRWVREAMSRAGAETRFVWGYRLGLAQGRAEGQRAVESN